jgi:hypothetical protein
MQQKQWTAQRQYSTKTSGLFRQVLNVYIKSKLRRKIIKQSSWRHERMEKVSFRDILFLLQMSRDLQMLFAAIAHLVEGLSLDTFFTLKVEKSLICFAGICKPTLPLIEQQLILFLKTLIRNKTSR